MDRTDVDSTTIASVGYDPGNSTLEIEFKTGMVYQYFGVPQHEHDALMAAESVGEYFSRAIRGAYPYART